MSARWSGLLLAAAIAPAGCAGGASPAQAPTVITVPQAESGRTGPPSALPSATSTSVTQPASPVASAQPAPDDVHGCSAKCTGSATADLATTLQHAAAGSRGCYNKALGADPALAGRMSIAIRIGPDGGICSVGIVESTMPADMADCVLGVFKGSSYAPPDGGCVNATVPLSFRPQVPQSGP